VVRLLLPALVAWFRPRHHLIAENLCLRQQLIVLRRCRLRPPLQDSDRWFWIAVLRWFPNWREALILVKPATVIGWHRKGWRAYRRWKSKRQRGRGRKSVPIELRQLIRRLATENPLWGQRYIQAELEKLGYKLSPRTVAKYMRRPFDGNPSPGWRSFLTRHAQDIWACDFFCVRTIFFRTLYVFFIIHHGTREIIHVRATRYPTAQWAAQQLLNACDGRDPPRYLIHDRDGTYGEAFDRRAASLGIEQIRTPVKAPKANANAIAERWVGTARRECLDWFLILNEQHLRQVVTEFASYYNKHRPHRRLDQRSPIGRGQRKKSLANGARIVGRPVLGGLHHVYQRVA